MPIIADNIKTFLSGGPGASTPAASLGGSISTTEVTDGVVGNLFDDVSSTEANDGDVEYRCFYYKNEHPSLTLIDAVVWIQTQTPSTDTSVEIAVDPIGVNGTGTTIGNESTAPSGPVFSAPTTEVGAITIGAIPQGQHIAIWIKRTVSALATAFNDDSVEIRIKGDTNA